MSKMFATHQIQFMLILLLSTGTTLKCLAVADAATPIPEELLPGFSAVPQSTTTSFQAVLNDPTGNFSLGFLRQNQNQLQLAVIHVASSEPFWVANPTRLASWAGSTRLSFNGSLVLWDSQTGIASWSTATSGDRAVLLNSSNLQIQNKRSSTPLWESFHFPTNTLVQDQNLTADKSLVSPNGLYSLRLGDTFMGLYANSGGEHGGGPPRQVLYWKHTAMEAKDEIREGGGPIYARVNTEGYLGMYQTTAKPVDVQKFNTFQTASSSFLLVRLESDGNLKGYYWDGYNWTLNYQAITETCELPSPCGSYGLCTPGGSGCSCLDNRTRFDQPGGCSGEVGGGGNLCGGKGFGGGESYRVLRRSGVEPLNKELVGHVTTSSLADCEGLCERNCSCWGALYSNATGFCYVLDYPIRTMVGTGDGSKVGYFKVREGEGGSSRVRVRARVGIVVGVLVLVAVGIFGVGMCVKRLERRRKRASGMMMKEDNGNQASPGPYKNLESASFRSIEMSTQ